MTEPIRVLVCDDQVLIRTGMATIIDAQPDLEVAGECGDGQTGVDLAQRLRHDVVVMDIRMPVLDGLEVTRLLAGARVPHPGKVLVVTTFNLDEYVYEALRGGERVPAQGRISGPAAPRNPDRGNGRGTAVPRGDAGSWAGTPPGSSLRRAPPRPT